MAGHSGSAGYEQGVSPRRCSGSRIPSPASRTSTATGGPKEDQEEEDGQRHHCSAPAAQAVIVQSRVECDTRRPHSARGSLRGNRTVSTGPGHTKRHVPALFRRGCVGYSSRSCAWIFGNLSGRRFACFGANRCSSRAETPLKRARLDWRRSPSINSGDENVGSQSFCEIRRLSAQTPIRGGRFQRIEPASLPA